MEAPPLDRREASGAHQPSKLNPTRRSAPLLGRDPLGAVSGVVFSLQLEQVGERRNGNMLILISCSLSLAFARDNNMQLARAANNGHCQPLGGVGLPPAASALDECARCRRRRGARGQR